jgi:3-oxoacyl-[acyl-carrier-protein] synthase II
MANDQLNLDPPQRRVVITGMGVIAPNGQDLDTFWQSIRKGISAANTVTRFDVSSYPNRIACEVVNFQGDRYMNAKKSRRLDLSIQYGIAASVQAVRDARLNFAEVDPDRVGLVEGTTIGGLGGLFKGFVILLQKGYKSISPFHLINTHFGGGSGEIALELGVRGLAVSYSSGSASGNDVMGYAMRMIQDDEVDVMVAGGAEASIVDEVWGTFCQTKMMTSRNDEPQRAMRPYDRTRDGFLLGEGAAFVVMEELTHALTRGARIYAEVMGHGRSCEAYSSLVPHPEGLGLRRAMEKALRQARMHYGEIDYINAHGTATKTNDIVETLAIKKTFGSHAARLAVSSTKPVTGHLLGAAGAVETVVCALALEKQEIPPTINLHNPEAGCDLDFVPNHGRPYPISAVMNLSVGFGGKNACLILRRFPARK